VGRATIFDKSGDYAAFEKVMRQAWERLGMRLLAYVLLPNHRHLVLWPQGDGYLIWPMAACSPLPLLAAGF
jgi:putative transposase